MEHQNWFKDWFNTKYYHLLYEHRDENEANLFILNLLRKVHLSKDANIWDNACGTGRHCYMLSKYGFNVIGTDICENNIIIAQKNYKERNLKFFIHDMRREFYVNYFDLVMNIFTSIGYFQNLYENEKAIKVMSDSLRKNGYILIDYFNPDYVIQNIVPHETFQKNKIVFDIKREINNNFVIKTIKVKDGNDEYVFVERVRLLTKDFFINTLTSNGISDIKVFGDYHLAEFNTSTSERMIFLGKKNRIV